jgi:pimeloyl-ACP methyl ester carboxylesterase
MSDPAGQAYVKEIAAVQDRARADLVASIPGATAVQLPDAGHYIQVERPDAVIDAVRAAAGRVRS